MDYVEFKLLYDALNLILVSNEALLNSSYFSLMLFQTSGSIISSQNVTFSFCYDNSLAS